MEHYYRHAAYKDYPVAGISYEQALAYCKWRTNIVKQFLRIKKKFNYPVFEYKLPSKYEWEMMAGAPYFNVENNTKRYNLNQNYFIDSIETKKYVWIEYADCTWPISYKQSVKINQKRKPTQSLKTKTEALNKNNFGLYNIIGNVAKMILEHGISKGGSWFHSVEESRLGNDIIYTKPTAWLGFRCVSVAKKHN